MNISLFRHAFFLIMLGLLGGVLLIAVGLSLWGLRRSE